MLILNATFILIHPLPDTLDKSLASDRMTIRSLLGQQSLNHRLCCNTGVIFTRNPECVITFHAMISNKHIFNRGSYGVSKM